MMSWIHTRSLGMYFVLAFVFGALLAGVAETVASVLMSDAGALWSQIVDSTLWMFVLACVATGGERLRRNAR